MSRHVDLSTPRQPRRISIHYDRDAFGAFSESIARFFGTARFLVIQTVIVILWISINIIWGLNVGNIRNGSFDPYPFILLNLAFSTQAAYAAPLILLAQNRQAERDRVEADEDRRRNVRVQADAEFLARELMSARLSLGRIEETIARMDEEQRERAERAVPPPTPA
jgi:uncharacterized membrane protein